MARLTLDQLRDKSRYEFKTEDVDLPELGGSVAVKTLSVAERDKLPDMTDENGKPNASVADLAKTFATIVSEPKLTSEEAEAILGDLPATALDKVIEKFSELLGTKEATDQTVREFPPSDD